MSRQIVTSLPTEQAQNGDEEDEREHPRRQQQARARLRCGRYDGRAHTHIIHNLAEVELIGLAGQRYARTDAIA